MASACTLDLQGALAALHGMLGQHVTVTVAPAPENHILATFGGELRRAHDLADDEIAFIIGDGRTGTGHFVLRPDTFTRATVSADGDVGIIASRTHLIIHGGRFTALLEEQ